MSALIARFRWTLCLVCLLLFVAQFSLVTVVAEGPTVALSAEERAVWTLVSDARAAAGLPTQPIDAQITALARARTADMATRHYFGHRSPDGATFLDLMPGYGIAGQLAGETIQENNFPQSATEAARALIASPEHHAILFDPRFTMAGVGHAVGTDGIHYYGILVVQP